jgi:hypothetical protein
MQGTHIQCWWTTLRAQEVNPLFQEHYEHHFPHHTALPIAQDDACIELQPEVGLSKPVRNTCSNPTFVPEV